MALEQQLEQFGLVDKKAKVYLACLELGPSSVQTIAKRTGIKRTSVYDLLSDLKLQGYVTETVRGKKKLIVATDPEQIKRILHEKEQQFDVLLPELRSLYNIPGVKPRIRFYEGTEGIRAVLEDTLTAKDKNLLGILSMEDLYDTVGEEYMENYVKRRIKEKFSLRVVRSREKEVMARWFTSKKEHRERRYAPKGIIFALTQYIYDNKVALLSSKKENFGMIIESQEFTENQRALFEVLWQASAAK